MNNDLISRSEAEKLGATCLARRNENGQLEAIISLDNAPTVTLPMCKAKDEAICEEMTTDGHCNCSKPCPNKESERPQGATNAEIFKQTFGIYATEVWSMSERNFLEWLNSEAKIHSAGSEARPQGKWIIDDGLMSCSLCQGVVLKRHFDYCPNCGAQMDEGEEGSL